MRVLIAEDDAALASFIAKGIKAESYAVDAVASGDDALYQAEQFDYDLVILDLNLPKMDGMEVLKRLRTKKPSLPVIVLTARTRVEDRVQSLDMGADDYVVKPFAFSELSARMRAVLRRQAPEPSAVMRVGDLEFDRIRREVKRNGQPVTLTSKEFALLEYLMLNTGRPVTRQMIVEHVWNLSFDTSTNVVDVYVNYLRKKIDEGYPTRLLRTVRGVGYQLGPAE